MATVAEVSSSQPSSSSSSSPGFVKYERMAESTQKLKGPEIHRIKHWIAMEKIHGANLSLTVWNKPSGDIGVKIARRNDFLCEGENFYGLDKQPDLLKHLHSCAQRLWRNMANQPDSLTIYGELFGGYYPHPSVPPIPGVISIQKEVAYCPELKFCAFDIVTCKGAERDYMDYDEAMAMLSEVGFMFSRPLCEGSFEDVFNFPLGFVTTLPADFGLPPIDNNLAEGVVVKPLKNAVLEEKKGQKRVIFKRKIEKFSERRALPKPPEHMTARSGSGKDSSSYEDRQEVQLLKYEIYALVTEQRLVNTMSKLGRPDTNQKWKELKDSLVEDVLESLKEDNEEEWAKCEHDPVAMATLTNETKKQCGILISQYKKTV